MTTPTVTQTKRPNLLMGGVRVLLGLFGAFKLYGTAYFTFFATAEEGGDPQGIVDWSVAAWSAALAICLMVAAARLGGGNRRVGRITGILLVGDILFSAVKLIGYDEPEAVVFMAVDLLLLALIALAVRRQR